MDVCAWTPFEASNYYGKILSMMTTWMANGYTFRSEGVTPMIRACGTEDDTSLPSKLERNAFMIILATNWNFCPQENCSGMQHSHHEFTPHLLEHERIPLFRYPEF